MDLSRAKTILIIAFLALNAFLCLRLWQSPQYLRVRGGLTAAEAEQVKNVLQEAGFELQAAVPRQTPRMSLLHVSRPPGDGESWASRFWPDGGVQKVSSPPGELHYVRGQQRLVIDAGGLLTFHRAVVGPAVPLEEGRLLSDRFLREYGILEDSLKFDLSFTEKEAYVYRYLFTYRGFPLFNSFTDVLIYPEGIGEVRVYRMEPLRFSGKEIQVISAAVAVRTLLEHKNKFQAKKIVDISLGYYSQVYNAERWEIAPVWRFAASDGTAFYVNAFSGEAEPDS
jgi:regulatory protein YycI of two-component signal transduction system YycFG